ncbi:MAG: Preprotein translocase subunit SecD [Candidatus Beckwithbacteria bacterium GW2011_GWB1_47_15]|uniref:Protein translocase subunit SecD n=1 Tax=Candidatus Beckwithbacteria bacterium GW2011_GWB1_47_15 TaxID=1618371 RepID=A0A0G1RXC9_9BACT|nr:MAG: protein-export membrane protein SecD, preprotein translocase subunit SecD [Candidatus Beckwithbacteria bacterium GW2011_GWC1_49_16]AQS30855.1 hypothetical protein [uncultured bacterium]KKU36040.1 MAG: Preprotein translocase subunit SecD [Candidatus Beckwithbacteria bacterium GW2011_GWA1_46_30]KKU62004.1 MAG: Preprotein translocase subunit SecD [Candidatus Beckwithbacteria bacterium GW2011_GWB1_47_15]KKU72442.1 MAG: Preprotein translocase subunit SecD [Candidatus Beckwithbacteria bacteri
MVNRRRLFFISLLTGLAILLNLPRFPGINLSLGPYKFVRDLNLRLGLDLQGGTHLVLDADMKDIAPEDKATALESAREVIARRVDLYGVTEPTIQTATSAESFRLIVELPGIRDVNQAVDLIGQTAQLDFRQLVSDGLDDEVASPGGKLIFVSTDLTGKDLKKSAVTYSPGEQGVNQPVVSLEFTPEGSQKFARLTQSNVGQPLAIFLDDQLVTAPIVNEPILNGQAVISGSFTPEAAAKLSIQLNAGALPVPIKVIEQENVSATLGSDSIQKSLTAGVVGLGLVMLFMIGLYGVNGFLADVALVIYGLITLSIYKLIPVTLTLPGIAGFILSVGMAVDSNILIFERLKEELRADRPFAVALELGFGRAWDSIKDANVATIITSLVLLNPLNLNWLNTSGPVRGFALTLFLGVVISLFTGIVVTRTLMRTFLLKHD